MKHRHSVAGFATAAFFAAAGAWGQSTQRAAFVANNGNLEGSVTSFRFAADGTPIFVAKFVTGSTSSTQNPVPGTNAYGISLSPDGAFLAVSHATGANVFEQLTVLRVNPDATVSPAGIFQTPDSPLDLEWVDNEYLAVTLTSGTNANNRVILYRYNRSNNTLTETDREPVGGFSAYLAISPNRRFVYTSESTFNSVRAFEVGSAGSLTEVGFAISPGVYPLGQGVSPDGRRMYTGGGISGNDRQIGGFDLDPDTGAVSFMPGAPWQSGGVAPKQALVAGSGSHVFVAHGTDATVRSFSIDGTTGALTATGFVFDVGIQGSLGEMARLGDLLLVTDRDTITDGVRGLLSFTINDDGSLTAHGPRVDTQGSTPSQLATWNPPVCAPDFDGDGFLTGKDFDLFVQAYEAGDTRADYDADGFITGVDFDLFVQEFEAGC